MTDAGAIATAETILRPPARSNPKRELPAPVVASVREPPGAGRRLVGAWGAGPLISRLVRPADAYRVPLLRPRLRIRSAYVPICERSNVTRRRLMSGLGCCLGGR